MSMTSFTNIPFSTTTVRCEWTPSPSSCVQPEAVPSSIIVVISDATCSPIFPRYGERFLCTFSALKQAVSGMMSCLVKIAIFKRLFPLMYDQSFKCIANFVNLLLYSSFPAILHNKDRMIVRIADKHLSLCIASLSQETAAES